MVEKEFYSKPIPIAWCPGCGNFGILSAVNKALMESNIEPQQVLFVSGIGQGPKLPHYTRGNVFNGLHGRTLPVATGAKLANHKLVVIGIDGDGGAYGEGLNHLVSSVRRNIDITYLVHNNQVYGLTKGQASPTSDLGFISKTTPFGAIQPLNPIALALASGALFVARGFAGDIDHLSALIKAGIEHKGFAFVDILQPCVSFNHQNTFKWYKDRVYKLDEYKDYRNDDLSAAFAKAWEWEDRIPIGIIYSKTGPILEEQFPALKRPLVEQGISPSKLKSILTKYT